MNKTFLYIVLFSALSFVALHPAARSSSAAAAAAAGALKKPMLTPGKDDYYRWPHYLTTRQAICGSSPHLSGDIDRKESFSHASPPSSCTTALQYALWFSTLDDFFQTVPEFAPGLRKLVCEYVTPGISPDNIMFKWSNEIATTPMNMFETVGFFHHNTQWRDEYHIVYLDTPIERGLRKDTFLVQHDTNNPLAAPIKRATDASTFSCTRDGSIIATISATGCITFWDKTLSKLVTHQLDLIEGEYYFELYWAPDNNILCVRTNKARIILCKIDKTPTHRFSASTYCTYSKSDYQEKDPHYCRWSEDSQSLTFLISTGCTMRDPRHRPRGARNTWQPYTIDIPSKKIVITSPEIDMGYERYNDGRDQDYIVESFNPSTCTLTIKKPYVMDKRLSLTLPNLTHAKLLESVRKIEVAYVSSFHQDNLVKVNGQLYKTSTKPYKYFSLIVDKETKRIIQFWIHDNYINIDTVSPNHSKAILKRGDRFHLLTPCYQPDQVYSYLRNMNSEKNYRTVLRALSRIELAKKIGYYAKLRKAFFKAAGPYFVAPTQK